MDTKKLRELAEAVRPECKGGAMVGIQAQKMHNAADAILTLLAEREELVGALEGAVEHMEWSTPQGMKAWRKAFDTIANIKESNK